MTSTLILYKNCQIIPEKNFFVDYLSNYLLTLETIQISDFQYIKHSLKLNIKINSSQVNLEMLEDNNFNYCFLRNNREVQGSSTNTYYYFIIGKKWISSSCIELSLAMDTINCGFEFQISNKTRILREHKDRFKVVGNEIYPLIDFYSEGLHPLLFQTDREIVKDWYSLGQETQYEENSFYLIYKTSTNDDEVVDTYLCADEELQIATASSDKRNGTFVMQPLNSVRYVFPFSSGNSNGSISYRRKGDYSPITRTITGSNAMFYLISTASISSGRIYEVRKYTWNGSQWTLDFSDELYNGDIAYTNIEEARIGGTFPASYSDISSWGEDFFANSPIAITSIKSIRSLDRSNSSLLKVIKLPYSPTPLTKDSNEKYSFDENIWEVGSEVGFQFLKLKDKNAKFENVINYFGKSPYKDVYAPVHYTNDRILKSIEKETKLYHSDYYLPKLVYDSFSFEFHLEDFADLIPQYMNLRLVITSTINSRFMFILDEYNVIGRARSDFYNVMPVARNNEMVLYNSAYLNYIRSGYNYDVKTKERNQVAQIAGAIGTTIGSITSFIVHPALGATTLASAITSYISTANNIAQNEQNIEQKLAQSKMQSVSVAGSDDVDLMSDYTQNNKAIVMFYEVSPKLKQSLFDLFYHQGYIADYYGVPHIRTRLNFNFVQAEIVFENNANLPQEILEDIRAKYAIGITYLHRWKNTWDFDQKYENWELFIPASLPTKTYTKVSSISDLSVGKKVLITTKQADERLGGGVLKVQSSLPNSISKTIPSGSSLEDNGSLDGVLLEVSAIRTNNQIEFKKVNGSASEHLGLSSTIIRIPEFSQYGQRFTLEQGSLRLGSSNEWLGYLVVENKPHFAIINGSGGNPPATSVQLYVLDE